MKSSIHFIITGGTIDSLYYPPTETTRPNTESIIPSYIQDVIKPHFKASFETLCLKDSRDITNSIRKKMISSIHRSSADNIIITHGTVTLTETAEFLDRHIGPTDKNILLVGAMIPLKEFVLSDGGFNLGFAVGSLSSLKGGVWICMNGKIFKSGHVKKNVKKARFE